MDTKGDGSVAKKLTDSLRRGRPHGLSVGIDLKRRSPTNPSFRCDFSDPGAVASAFLDSDADFVFANCDFSSYGGELNDIKQIVSATRASSPSSAVIFKVRYLGLKPSVHLFLSLTPPSPGHSHRTS